MLRDTPEHTAPTARLLAAQALGRAAAAFPHLDPAPFSTAGLDPRDARLSTAIRRAALHHWLTAEFLLDRYLHLPSRRLQPELRGILLAGAVQLLFFDRLPAYAVVDESVSLARELVRKNARGLVNAVLRKLADAIDHHDPQTTWVPASNRIPSGTGTLFLKEGLLPDPATQLARHLSVATSHPSALVERWLELFDRETVLRLCRHGIQIPPIIVAVEKGFILTGAAETRTATSPVTAHDLSGYVLWRGDHEQLVRFLAEHPARRVQDPASARPVALVGDLSPRLVLDLCAGRGTKTRQLAIGFPSARILASDVDSQRLLALRETAQNLPHVEVVEPRQVETVLAGQKADLLVLDVPCSNTAVLARRPEARYRYRPATLQSLIALQQEILRRGLSLLSDTGHLLYATCSLEPAENQEQVQKMAAPHGLKLLREESQLPGGSDIDYHDGFYAALLGR